MTDMIPSDTLHNHSRLIVHSATDRALALHLHHTQGAQTFVQQMGFFQALGGAAIDAFLRCS